MLNKFFGRKEAERMSKMQPDEPAQERTLSPDLDTWMDEASAVGLVGEQSHIKKAFKAGDVRVLAKESVPVVASKETAKIPERHGLHLIKTEASNTETEAKNEDLEDRLKKVMGNLDGLQEQVANAQAELRAILEELAVEKAKAKVQGAA